MADKRYYPHKLQGLNFRLIRVKFWKLLFLYLFFVILQILIFGSIYWVTHSIVDSNHQPQTYWSSIYFSIVTHFTVGYGDLVPVGIGRALILIQVIASTLFAALFLGIVIAKLIWPPSEAIIISSIVIYDYLEKKFRFRFFNGHTLPLHDSEYKVWLRGVAKTGDQFLHRNYMIALQFKGHPMILPGKPWFVNTMPVINKPEDLNSAKENVLCPKHLNRGAELILQIRGNYPQIGGQPAYAVRYVPFERIVCGRPELVEKIDKKGNVVEINWENFEAYTPVSQTECNSCSLRDGCLLSKESFE